MKNIMLSIRPEWLQKILSGQKTVELRLSRPNLTPPLRRPSRYFSTAPARVQRSPVKFLKSIAAAKSTRQTVLW